MRKIENELLNQFICSYPEHSTNILSHFTVSEVATILLDLPSSVVVSILNRLSPNISAKVLISFPPEKFIKIYGLLDPIRGAHLFSILEINEREEKIALLPPRDQKDIEALLVYPSESAGSLMDTSVRACGVNESVRDVIVNYKKFKSTSRDIFVVDLEGHLVGYVPAHELLSLDGQIIIKAIMHKSPPFVSALSPKSEVVEIFETFKSTILPVTHTDGTLLGAIRYSSLVSEMQNQAISRMATLGGASLSEKALSPPFFSVGKRLPWLLINLLTAFIASAVVGFFEDTIAKVTALAVLLPVVAGQSGNTGAQAMAVTMRSLALREVRVKQWLKILFKELRVGFINGVAVAVVTGLCVYFWSQSFPLGVVMTVAMIFSMVIASLAGAAIPIILTSIGKDPAQSSSVILTTVTDVFGFLSFLGLATLFVKLLTNL